MSAIETYEEFERLPPDGPERVQNILILCKILVDDLSKKRAQDGGHDNATRIQEGLNMDGKNTIFLEWSLPTMTAPKAETFSWAYLDWDRTDCM